MGKSKSLKLWEQFNRILGREGGRPSSGFYRALLLLLLLGSGLLWLGSCFSSDRPPSSPPSPPAGVEETGAHDDPILISELTAMIEEIKGVRNVKIFLTLETGRRQELVADEECTSRQTLEEDSSGGRRETIEENNRETYVILRDTQGREQPLVIREFSPCYRGVLVVAEGVEDPAVKARVVEALRAVLNLSYHRITVLPRGN